jgi:hypothetical protein
MTTKMQKQKLNTKQMRKFERQKQMQGVPRFGQNDTHIQVTSAVRMLLEEG